MRNFSVAGWVSVLALALALGFAGVLPARADVFIAPNSRNAAQLTPQSTSFEVQINPAARLARITSTWVFDNTSPADFEAEFEAQSPPNSLMTQFSYWFKGQKTLARIVENSRAARIYSQATTAYHPRDPALVEMLARNDYRVRIAPVEAKKPLRIELVWLQPLEKQNDEWRLTLPWSESGRVKKAGWKFKATFSAPVQNLDSPFPDAKTSPSSLEFAPPAGTALPAQTVLSWTSSSPPVWLQSRTGSDGFFVGIVDEAVWKKWENWTGVTKLHSVNLGDGRRVVAGRFAKTSPAKTFGFGVQDDIEQSQNWWAALELDEMAHSRRNNYQDGIALSTRFGLPSAWTSWLAIPDSERQKLADIIDEEKIQQARSDVNRLGWALADWKATGDTTKPQFKAMLADFRKTEALALRGNPNPYDKPRTLDDFYRDSAERWLSNTRGGEVKTARAAQKTINALLQGVPDPQNLRGKAAQNVRTLIDTKNRLAKVQALSKQALARANKGGSVEEFLAPIRAQQADIGLDTKLGFDIARQSVQARKSDPLRAARLQKLLEALTAQRTAEDDAWKASYFLGNVETELFGDSLDKSRQELASEIIAGREDGAKAKELRAKITALLPNFQNVKPAFEPDLTPKLEELQAQLQHLQGSATLDEAAVARVQGQIEHLRAFVGETTFKTATATDSSWRNYEGVRFMSSEWVKAKNKGGADSLDAMRVKVALQALLDQQWELEKERYSNMAISRANYDAQIPLRKAEAEELDRRAAPLFQQWVNLRAQPVQDEKALAAVVAQMDELQKQSVYNPASLTNSLPGKTGWVLKLVETQLHEELEKPRPDAATVAGLSARLAEFAPSRDRLYQRFWTGNEQNELRGSPADYARLRVQRIGVQNQIERAKARLALPKTPVALRQGARREIAQLQQLENQMRVRMGDPLIRVLAARDASGVLAILPSGELLPLRWNDSTGGWEARFDVPTWARQGEQAVQIIVSFKNGARQKLTMRFVVDTQSPTGKASARGGVVQVETDALTDRVSAFGGDGSRLELVRGENNVFKSPGPLAEGGVRLILTDKAHNRTEIWLEK